MNISAIELVPAVIYARFSSSGQREESIIGQVRARSVIADPMQSGSAIGSFVLMRTERKQELTIIDPHFSR